MLKNFILNLSFVKEAIANSHSGEKIRTLQGEISRLQGLYDNLVNERAEKTASNPQVLGDVEKQITDLQSQLDAQKVEVSRLFAKNENSEKKIASLSAENLVLKNKASEPKSEVQAEGTESEKELRKRNGIQSDTIHRQMLEISELKNKIRSKSGKTISEN